MYKKEYLVYVITLLGFLIRIYRLGSNGLIIDEGDMIVLTSADISVLPQLITLQNYPHLYFYFLHIIQYFGYGEIFLRMHSVIIGSALIFVVYALAKRLLGTETALISSLIIALSPFHIYLSRLANYYSLDMFLGTLSMYFFWMGLEKRTLTYWLVYLLCSILSMYTHLTSFFYLLVQNIFIVYFFYTHHHRRGDIVKWAALQALILLAVLPIFLQGIGFHFDILNWISFYKGKSNMTDIVLTFLVLAFGYPDPDFSVSMAKINWHGTYTLSPLEQLKNFIFQFIPSYPMMSCIFLILLIIIAWGIVKGWNKRKEVIFLICFLCAPILFLYGVSKFLQLYIIRYMMITIPAYCILLAFGISRVKVHYRKVILVVFIALTFLYYSIYQLHHPDIQDLRKTAVFIMNNYDPDDVVVIMGHVYQMGMKYYLGRKDIQTFSFTDFLSASYPKDYLKKAISREVTDIANNYKRIWLVPAQFLPGSEPHLFEELIEKKFEKIIFTNPAQMNPGFILYRAKK